MRPDQRASVQSGGRERQNANVVHVATSFAWFKYVSLVNQTPKDAEAVNDDKDIDFDDKQSLAKYMLTSTVDYVCAQRLSPPRPRARVLRAVRVMRTFVLIVLEFRFTSLISGAVSLE